MTPGARQGFGALLAVVIAASVGLGFGPTALGDRLPSAADGATQSRPAHWPERFGFGVAADSARISAWDIDVKPDGEGLPPGSGSVSDGARVYVRVCRSCHGATGTEGPNDALVAEDDWERWPPSRAVGVYWPYATTLFDYISKAMPQKRPGTLSADDTYAVIAYILHLNGLVPEDAVMDAQALPRVVMPARDRFVPDDRRGGPEVR